jgi:hypothetical protein
MTVMAFSVDHSRLFCRVYKKGSTRRLAARSTSARPGVRVTKIRTQEGMLQAQTVREKLLRPLLCSSRSSPCSASTACWTTPFFSASFSFVAI